MQWRSLIEHIHAMIHPVHLGSFVIAYAAGKLVSSHRLGYCLGGKASDFCGMLILGDAVCEYASVVFFDSHESTTEGLDPSGASFCILLFGTSCSGAANVVCCGSGALVAVSFGGTCNGTDLEELNTVPHASALCFVESLSGKW